MFSGAMELSAKVVLYLEDDPHDVLFLRHALNVQNVNCRFCTISNVTAAKSYLSGESPYDDAQSFPPPAVLVTDSAIPGPHESSLELIAWIRSHPRLKDLPVVCATGNQHPAMHEAFEKLGVRCHLKSSQMTEIAAAVKAALIVD